MKEQPPQQLMNISDVARRLSVSERYVRHLVYTRRIAYVKIGRHVRFEQEALQRLISDGQTEAA